MNELQERVLAALRSLHAEHDPTGSSFTALEIARRAQIRGARRRGNGAVKGTWSGTTSPALSVAATLRALERAGLVDGYDEKAYGRRRRRYSAVAS